MARAGSTGVFEPGLAYAIGVPGRAMTTAGNASVIAALEPVFIFLGACLVFGTRLALRAAAAVGTAFIGVVLVSLIHAGDLGGGSVAGDGLILLATGFAAVHVLASSRMALSMPAVLLTALQQSVGLVFVLVLTAITLPIGWQSLPGAVTGPMLALAVLSGLIQYALAFWLYIVALKGVPPGIAGMFLTTTPIFGVLGGVVFLGEGFATSQLVGMAPVILSLPYLVRSLDRGGWSGTRGSSCQGQDLLRRHRLSGLPPHRRCPSGCAPPCRGDLSGGSVGHSVMLQGRGVWPRGAPAVQSGQDLGRPCLGPSLSAQMGMVEDRDADQRPDGSEAEACPDPHRHGGEDRIDEQRRHAEDRGARGQHDRAQAADRGCDDGLGLRQDGLLLLQVGLLDQDDGVLDEHAREADEAEERGKPDRQAGQQEPDRRQIQAVAGGGAGRVPPAPWGPRGRR